MPRASRTRLVKDRSMDPPSIGDEWRVGCDRCGSAYERNAWLALPLVARLEPEWLMTQVVGWRDDAIIEVRRCGRCGTAMSRRAPADAKAAAVDTRHS
jgi:hypothetical protein